MPQEFLSMTLQSFWDGKPHGAVTAVRVMETDGMTAQEVYGAMRDQTVKEWKGIYTRTILGEVVVLHYHRELNEPQSSTDIALV